MIHYFFDSAKTTNLNLLLSIGFTKEQIQDGLLTSDEVKKAKMDPLALSLISMSEIDSQKAINKKIRQPKFEFSDNELQTLKTIFDKSQAIPTLSKFLFINDGIDDLSMFPFFYNYLKNEFHYFKNLPSYSVESLVPLSAFETEIWNNPSFAPLLSSIYFSDSEVPSAWDDTLKQHQIHFITQTRSGQPALGSAVCISDDGVFLSASHLFPRIIRENDGTLHLPNQFKIDFDDQSYTFEPNEIEILEYDVNSDSIKFRIKSENAPKFTAIPIFTNPLPPQATLVSFGPIPKEKPQGLLLQRNYSFVNYDSSQNYPKNEVQNLLASNQATAWLSDHLSNFDFYQGNVRQGFSGSGLYYFDPVEEKFYLVSIVCFSTTTSNGDFTFAYPAKTALKN